MSTPQKQDLVLFSDQSVIPKELYSNGSHHVLLITSTIETQPLWLISALIETRLMGAPYSLNRTTPAQHASLSLESSFTIASLVHNSSFYQNTLHKLKINPNAYNVIDLISNFVLKNSDKPRDKILDKLLELFPNDVKSIVVLEQPELLLSLIDGLSSDELNDKFIVPLMRRCGLLIIATSVDQYQDNENDPLNNENREVIEFTRLITSLIYKSIGVLSLVPLETGRAKDITGTLKITRGGQLPVDLSTHIVENEYLYLTEKESTKLFYR